MDHKLTVDCCCGQGGPSRQGIAGQDGLRGSHRGGGYLPHNTWGRVSSIAGWLLSTTTLIALPLTLIHFVLILWAILKLWLALGAVHILRQPLEGGGGGKPKDDDC